MTPMRKLFVWCKYYQDQAMDVDPGGGRLGVANS
jgi:hypothetical protein